MLTIHAQLEINDKEALDKLMRTYSSCMRFAYQRIINNESPKKHNDFHKLLKSKFNLNYRYIEECIQEAQQLASSCEELKTNPHKVIFGSKKAFLKLKKRHLSEQQRQELKEQYKEIRQCNLYSRGDKNRQGNLNTQIQGNKLRINVGFRKYIYVTIHHKSKRFNKVFGSLCYSVRIIRRNSIYYAHFAIDEKFPKAKITKDNGVIGIDLNAFPSNIAWCETNKDGNYISSGTINTPELYDCRGPKRDYYVWKYAHKITDLALKQGKALVIEDLKNLKGLNRALGNWCRGKLKEAIITFAKRKGVEIKLVNPAYTSIIGCVKYAPLYNLSRHTSAALVIGRRGLGFKEKLPKIFTCLINEVGVPQEKKKTKFARLNQKFKRIYEVCKKAVLTEQFTGPTKGKLPNWSILKSFIMNQDYSKFKKLAPLFGSGAKMSSSLTANTKIAQ